MDAKVDEEVNVRLAMSAVRPLSLLPVRRVGRRWPRREHRPNTLWCEGKGLKGEVKKESE